MPIALDLTRRDDRRRAARIRSWIASMSDTMKIRLQQIAGESEVGPIHKRDIPARTLYRRGFVAITQSGAQKLVVVTPLGEAALACHYLQPITLTPDNKREAAELLRAQGIARVLGGRTALTLKRMVSGRPFRPHAQVIRSLQRNGLLDGRGSPTERGLAVAEFL